MSSMSQHVNRHSAWVATVLAAIAFLAFIVPVRAAPPLYITTTSLPAGETDSVGWDALDATGGIPPYRWAITAGALPSGFGLNGTTGVISGMFSLAGTANFEVQVTDATGIIATEGLAITTQPRLALDPMVLPAATVGVTYAQTVPSSGGLPPFTWAIPLGALPEGLTLDRTTGQLRGVPASAGTAAFTVQVSDGANRVATSALSLVVNDISSTAPSTTPGVTLPITTTSRVSVSTATGLFAARPVFSDDGLGNAVFLGGTIAQLDTALVAVGASGAWAQDATGQFSLYVVGGTFVNGNFYAAFAGGLPNPSAVMAVRE